MVKAAPFVTGLSSRTEAWIEDQTRQTGQPREAIVATLVEEAARTRLFPGIAFRGPEHARRAWLPGAGYDAWQVIEA